MTSNQATQLHIGKVTKLLAIRFAYVFILNFSRNMVSYFSKAEGQITIEVGCCV